MALSPQERSRRMRLNMLMGMSYAAFASSKSDPAAALLGTETQGLALDFLQDTYAVRRLPPIGTQTGKAVNFITFSRTSNATVVDSDGVIKWAPHNLLTNSEQLDNTTGFSSSNITIAANATAAPNGTTTAEQITPNTALGFHRIFGGSVTTTNLVFACFVKANGYTKVGLRESATTGAGAAFNLSGSGSVIGAYDAGGSTVSNMSITSLSNGWFYISCNISFASATAMAFGLNVLSNAYASGDLNASWSGDGTSGVFAWGASLYRNDLGGMQTNTSAYPMYNPTTSAAYYGPRRDFDPVTLACKGLLVEEQRTNLLLNSATLSTQNVTTTAVAHTLSFYGTGTVTLSGTSTAGPLVGTGAANRVTLTFTPTAGTLTLTVTGSVTQAQLEAGSFATSYIPTGAATATRAVDVASVSTLAFPHSESNGTWVAAFQTQYSGTAPVTAHLINYDGSGSKRVLYFGAGSDAIGSFDGTTILNATGDVTGSVAKSASAYTAAERAVVSNGGTVTTGSTVAGYSSASIAYLGSNSSVSLNGWVRQITYLPRRISNAELQQRTSA